MFKHLKAGNQSTNVQTESITINKGITYADAREIALDVFRANFLQLSEQAACIARKRAEEITDKFIKQLEKQNNSGVVNAQDPDFQHALFIVQKEYARTGDEDLGDLLVDLLVDRTKHDKRTILQIVLNESLSAAPKLTNDQLAALSIVFIINHTIDHGLNNLQSFSKYLDSCFAPYANILTENQSCYQHLAFAGCGTISIGNMDIIQVLKHSYKGLFSKGFTNEDVENANVKFSDFPTLFTSCLHESNKIQINAMSEDVLREKAKNMSISEKDLNALINLNNSFLMTDDEARSYIIKERDYMEKVFTVWKNSYMKNLTLTSVGIAIGHANVKRNIGEFTDLSIWIN